MNAERPSVRELPGPLDQRNRDALTRWMFRRAQERKGHVFPDARDQELRDRGAVLFFRAGAIRRAMKKGYRV